MNDHGSTILFHDSTRSTDMRVTVGDGDVTKFMITPVRAATVDAYGSCALSGAQMRALIAHANVDADTAPVELLMHCPMCNARHIDEGEFATKPHHTHACQNCGHVWRPAIGPTVGVRFLPGFKNDQTIPGA